MCMDTNNKGQFLFRTATRDIKVYKVLERVYKNSMPIIGRGKSPYQQTEYKRGFLKTTNKIVIDSGGIYQGLHSYADKKVANRYGQAGSRFVVEMIIPCGALYCINKDTGECVSDALYWPGEKE